MACMIARLLVFMFHVPELRASSILLEVSAWAYATKGFKLTCKHTKPKSPDSDAGFPLKAPLLTGLEKTIIVPTLFDGDPATLWATTPSFRLCYRLLLLLLGGYSTCNVSWSTE